jgi:hypothetical protein
MGNYKVTFSEIKKIKNNEFIIIKTKNYSNYFFLKNSYINNYLNLNNCNNSEILEFMEKNSHILKDKHYYYLLNKIYVIN